MHTQTHTLGIAIVSSLVALNAKINDPQLLELSQRSVFPSQALSADVWSLHLLTQVLLSVLHDQNASSVRHFFFFQYSRFHWIRPAPAPSILRPFCIFFKQLSLFAFTFLLSWARLPILASRGHFVSR